MTETISITAIASISPLGVSQQEIWQTYLKEEHLLTEENFDTGKAWVSGLSDRDSKRIGQLVIENPLYRNLDKSVLYALYASRNAVKRAGWVAGERCGVNIGSSRGATSLLEQYHREFITAKTVSTQTSPTTTLGNISSWVAHDLQTEGPEISHSITCSTALHAVLNGIAWIRSGMTDKFLAGGTEAPLTSFTLAQMQALKIYSKQGGNYPCRAFDLEKTRNTMVLGEGAAVACLEAGLSERTLTVVEGIGFATELLEHPVSISSDADCFQKSMKMALGEIPSEEVDAIVMHAPGTIKGDNSEYRAIQKIFTRKLPALTTNKWKVGHTFGASGMLSVELAILMIKHQKFIHVPFAIHKDTPKKLKRVLVNAVGFGGNAVSILLRAPGSK